MKKLENGKEQIYYVGDDVHTLCIGATRSGKSRTIVVQSICTLGLAGESLLVSDPKGELYQYTNEFLQKLGYDVKVLDFKNPEKSHRYNLLQPVIDAVNRNDFEKAEMTAWDMTNTLVGKYLKKAGLANRGLSTHKLRHSAATILHRYGHVDVRTLQVLLGHESIATTQIYTNIDNEQLQSAVNSNPLASMFGK